MEARLSLSPNGTHIAYTKNANIFVMDEDGTDHRQIAEMWSRPNVDWSPDGKWLTYATEDHNYNSDVFIVPVDGTREPFNLSRHPDYDAEPTWSADGKRIAWVGYRDGDEADIYVITLAQSTDEETERDELLEKAMEAMKDKKGKRKKDKPEPGKDDDEEEDGEDEDQEKDEEEPSADDETTSEEEDDESESEKVVIDFDGIFDRVDRLRYRDSRESDLIWMEDGATLAFTATIDGKRAFYKVAFPARKNRRDRRTTAKFQPLAGRFKRVRRPQRRFARKNEP